MSSSSLLFTKFTDKILIVYGSQSSLLMTRTHSSDTRAWDFRGLFFAVKQTSCSDCPRVPLLTLMSYYATKNIKFILLTLCVGWAIVVIDNPCDTTHTMYVCWDCTISLFTRRRTSVYGFCANERDDDEWAARAGENIRKSSHPKG